MPKTRLGLGGRDHGLTIAHTLFWVLELVGRGTRVLVSTQAIVMALGEMTSESDLDNVKHGRRQWSKEHLESTYIFIVFCDVFLLISVFFLVRSHHFDCFSAHHPVVFFLNLYHSLARTGYRPYILPCHAALSHLSLELTCASNY
jgi:hypothetical protein